MTQKSLLHAVAAQIANGYETAEVPMYSEQLRMPDRKVIIKIIENLQKVFFPAYFAGGTVSHVSAERLRSSCSARSTPTSASRCT